MESPSMYSPSTRLTNQQPIAIAAVETIAASVFARPIQSIFAWLTQCLTRAQTLQTNVTEPGSIEMDGSKTNGSISGVPSKTSS